MIYLSFDIEEFDMPKEYGFDIPFERQMNISHEGLTAILDLLQKHEAKATFFSTVIFAQNAPELIQRLLSEGHELASHTYYHSDFAVEHLSSSKEALESQFGVTVEGLRMPRMLEVSATDVKQAGYTYNSSVNPTFLPGRFTDLHQKEFNFPFYVMRNTGEAMITRFDKLLSFAKEKNWKVERYKKLIEKNN